jgi:signal transduction histidine kinase
MANEITSTGSATMRPRARLISLLGNELISDEPVALVELVKNSYDADATTVDIRFEGKDPERPQRIIVVDDGIGMDLKTFLEGWFEPGTIIKQRKKTSPSGRILQGAKGVGRFASARLAQDLFLESKQERKEAVCVLLEWGKFSDESYLDEIRIDYEVRKRLDFNHGTRLMLKGLRKSWSDQDYEELHARLSRLISPFNDIKDFTINLDIPKRPDLSGEVRPPEFILQPRYMLKGILDKEGIFDGEMLIDGKTRRKLDRKKIGGKTGKPLCGPFEVEVRAWDRDREGLQPISERFDLSVTEIRRILNAYCGVSIYRDGFRVYPYGQKGSDWLVLDIRSRLNPVMSLANNQVIAAVRISRKDNPELIDRTTREGMVLNAQHSALEKWFKEILCLLEEERYRVRPRQETIETREPLFESFDISSVVKEAKKELGKEHPVTVLISDTEKQLKEGVERVQDVFSRLLMSAGLGHMVDIVIHEIGSPLGKINRQIILLDKELDKCVKGTDRNKISEMITSIKGWLEQIYNLRRRLEPQTPAKRGRATMFDVREEIEDNFNLYEALIAKQGINYRIKAPKQPVHVKMVRATLGQILANLIDNSIYWLVRDKGPSKGGVIDVQLKNTEKGFTIIFSDDGPGVSPEDQDRIFEPYFTRKPNGMGLGLYIARLVIEPYGKLIYKEGGSELPGACFEATFERGVGK